jgi:DNA-binding MarR family transcriptional regulator
MTQPIDPRTFASTCLCLSVRRAARSIGRQYDDAFRHLGINNGQFTILMAASADRTIGIAELAQELAMDASTLTAALKPLERDGLITLAQDLPDRRSKQVRLTVKGRNLLEQAVPIWWQAQSALLAQTGLEHAESIRSMLSAMT